MKLTWIDLNSWIFQIAGYTVLVDPWLVDPMVFYGQPWLFTAHHKHPIAFSPETLPTIDLILISQGLDDHCHVPTLERLDRTIPVIASPTAAKVVKKLGFQDVTALTPWESHPVSDQLVITATQGGETQPGQVENGFLLKEIATNKTLYYEPHWFPTEATDRIGSVDVAIAPVIGQVFPLMGQIIMGPDQALAMLSQLSPTVFLPTTRGEVRSSGILSMLIKSVGSVEEFRDRLIASGLSTKLIIPEIGEAVEVSG